MNSTTSIHQKLCDIAVITKKIVELLNNCEKEERSNTYRRSDVKKHIDELKPLMELERKSYDEIVRHDDFSDALYSARTAPVKFNFQFGVYDETADRIIYNMLVAPQRVMNIQNRMTKEEFIFNILDEYSEFITLTFPKLLSNHILVFDALKEEMFKNYLAMLDRKIKNPSYRNVRDNLISKKYRLLKMYSPASKVFVDSFYKTKLRSRLEKIEDKTDIDFMLHSAIKSEYVYHFFDIFFRNNLGIEDKDIYIKENFSVVIDKITLAEVMLDFLSVEGIERVETNFYKYYYQINQSKKIENKIISELIVNLINESTKRKRRYK